MFSTVGSDHGAWGSSEPGPGAEPEAEIAPRDELQAAACGEAAPRLGRQGSKRVDEPAHDRLGAAIVVAEQDRVAGCPLHDRRDVGRPVLAAEDHEIALPVAELGAAADCLGPVADGHMIRKHRASRLPCEPQPSPAPPLRQVPRQLLALSPGIVDEPVDGLVAQPMQSARLDPEPPGDLLRRPARAKPVEHGRSQLGVTLELGARMAPSRSCQASRQTGPAHCLT